VGSSSCGFAEKRKSRVLTSSRAGCPANSLNSLGRELLTINSITPENIFKG
jgi:hypothetical protein